MTYEMDIAGLKRDLPLCKVSDDLYIGAFVMFGDVELTVHCAAELLKLTPEYDYLIAPEAKAIPLVYEMARQLVNHAHFTVNGQKVNIPSYLVRVGDVIEVRESSRSSVAFKRLTGEDAPLVTVPQWLERDKNALKGTVTKMPAREDIDMPIEEHLIVELYSK